MHHIERCYIKAVRFKAFQHCYEVFDTIGIEVRDSVAAKLIQEGGKASEIDKRFSQVLLAELLRPVVVQCGCIWLCTRIREMADGMVYSVSQEKRAYCQQEYSRKKRVLAFEQFVSDFPGWVPPKPRRDEQETMDVFLQRSKEALKKLLSAKIHQTLAQGRRGSLDRVFGTPAPYFDDLLVQLDNIVEQYNGAKTARVVFCNAIMQHKHRLQAAVQRTGIFSALPLKRAITELQHLLIAMGAPEAGRKTQVFFLEEMKEPTVMDSAF